MRIKITIQVTILLLLFQFQINAQVNGDLNTTSVSELDAIQLPSGTWIAAPMENISSPDIARVVIHRSIDNGATWAPVDSVVSDNVYDAVADPSLSMDNEGNAYLLIMQRLKSGASTVHLTLLVSEDDGLTWSVKSQPYIEEYFSDTPHLLIDDLNRFYISYTEFRFSPFASSTHFIKSEDGGLTWTAPIIFESLQSDIVVGAYLNFSDEEQLNLVYNDHPLPFTYFTSSGDNGNTWNPIIEFPNTKRFSTNKIISHKKYESICILTHEAHNPTSGIHYNYSIDNGQSWDSYNLVNNASMAEGFMDDEGFIHITYNEFDENDFMVNYIYSMDGGVSFSDPLTLFRGETYTDITSSGIGSIAGESQSMKLGNDNMIHLTFVDWTDFSKAKHLFFEPFNLISSSQNSELISDYKVALFPNPATDYITLGTEKASQFSTWNINSIDGRRISSGDFNSNTELRININHLEPGTYLLNFQSDTRIVVKKFIKI